MHNSVIFNFGKFKSHKCLISFSRDYASQGEKNKKALKNQGFSWLYLFYSPYLVAEMGFEQIKDSAVVLSAGQKEAVFHAEGVVNGGEILK